MLFLKCLKHPGHGSGAVLLGKSINKGLGQGIFHEKKVHEKYRRVDDDVAVEIISNFFSSRATLGALWLKHIQTFYISWSGHCQ